MPSVTRKSQQGTRAARRAEICRRLLVVVETALAEGESYTEMSVERLVKAAGLSRSTFYVYFEDKGDVLRALTEDAIAEMVEAAGVWWGLPPSASKDEVREALSVLFEKYLEHKLLMSAVIEAMSYDENVREAFAGMMDVSARELANHIRSGQEQGFVHPELNPDVTAGWLTWMAERGLYELVAPAGKAARNRLLTALTDIVWNTLYQGTR